MIRIDKQLLAEIGLGSLSEADKEALLRQIVETLEIRVGQKLANQMSNEQLEEFEVYYNSKDEQGAYKWLETNFPNYKEIVQIEFDNLKKEITQAAPQILEASNNSNPNPNIATPPGPNLQNPINSPNDLNTPPPSYPGGANTPPQAF